MSAQSNQPLSQGNLAALVVFVSTIFTIVFWQRIVLNEVSDLHLHIEYARQIGSITDITSPHFLFQLLIKAIHALTGASLEAATALLLGACYGLMAIILALEIQRRMPTPNAKLILLLVCAILIASHIFLLTLLKPNLYYGYLVTTAYHNPTQQLNKLFALAIWVLFCSFFVHRYGIKGRVLQLVLLASLCILSAIAKPSFLIAFLPVSAAFISFGFLRTTKWRPVTDYTFSVILPSTAVIAWQFWTTYGRTRNGIEFAPFAIFTDPTQYVVTLPLALAFPVATLILLWRYAKNSQSFLMAWAFLIIGLFFTFFLAETGPRRMQGNFAWTAQTGAFLVYVEALLLLTKDGSASGKFNPILVVILSIHVLCGIIYAVANAAFPAPLWL